mgnify:CR=1 FL=1
MQIFYLKNSVHKKLTKMRYEELGIYTKKPPSVRRRVLQILYALKSKVQYQQHQAYKALP